jgi:hypothetical protein
MAKVTMDFRDLDDYELPDVCMQCGAPAEGRKSKLYSWYHPEFNLLIFGMLPGWILLAALSNVLTKRRQVERPLCAKHINQWPWRTFTALGGFALFVVVGFAAAFVMATPERGGKSNPLGGILCAEAFVILLVWLVVVVVISSSTIRPTVITDESITLTNVSKEFVLAYEDEMERDNQSRIDDEVRDRWRNPRDDRLRRPNSSRPPSDAYEPE